MVFKIGDKVRDNNGTGIGTVIDIKNEQELKVNWCSDSLTDEIALRENSFWPANDFQLITENGDNMSESDTLTLGSILQSALDNVKDENVEDNLSSTKVTTMEKVVTVKARKTRKIESLPVWMRSMLEERKTDSIKELSSLSGCSIMEAKTIVENFDQYILTIWEEIRE